MDIISLDFRVRHKRSFREYKKGGPEAAAFLNYKLTFCQIITINDVVPFGALSLIVWNRNRGTS